MTNYSTYKKIDQARPCFNMDNTYAMTSIIKYIFYFLTIIIYIIVHWYICGIILFLNIPSIISKVLRPTHSVIGLGATGLDELHIFPKMYDLVL